MLTRETFRDPPSEYRPIPFWFWNSRLGKEETEAQIRDFHAKGVGGFFIHARFGLETEYLSREWMDCVEHAVAVAEELGMEVWLYDENGFPSGIGDLKVSRIREYRSTFIDLTERRASAGEHIELDLPAGEVLMAHANRTGDPASEATDLSSYISDNKLKWTPPKGQWDISVYSKCVLQDPNDVVFGVDYLNPEAMQYFFDLTLDPYDKALGKHFGKTIKGIFTDEPTLLPWHHDICWYGLREHARVVVWDDRIEQEMKSHTGKDATAFLPHLFFDIDESTPEVRRTFWRTVSDLYLRAFFAPYRKWCEDRNLKLTGHVLFEEGLYLNADFQSDITAALSQMHIPGTDHLGEATETPYGGHDNLPQHLTNLQGQKLVTSIGHHTGSEAVLSETYGCAGWGLTFERMKWIADWQYSLGINMLCPHAMFYSIEGFRKSDAPPSQSHTTPWKHYRAFADYIGRLSYMLRQGAHVAKVALFYPLSEFWGHHAVGRIGKEDKAISDSFDLCASALARLHFDYDIISDRALESATAENGAIRIQDEAYDVLIAGESAMEEAASDVVKRFRESGGTCIDSPNASEDVAEVLDRALQQAIMPDVQIRSVDGDPLPDVRYVHRRLGEQHIFFFANTSDRPAQATILLETVGSVEQWRPETGDVTPAEGAEVRDGVLRIEHDFPAYGSAIYVVDTKERLETRPNVTPDRSELIVFADEWRFEAQDPNALVLDDLTFHPVTHGSGADYTYTATFNCEHVPSPLFLMLDDVEYRTSLMGGMHVIVDVNGTVWDRPEFGHYLDTGFKTLDISPASRPGKSTLKIVIKHSAWSGQPHLLNTPPCLLGNFAVHGDTRTLLPPAEAAQSGSWTDFGYPFFSGTGVYMQRFTLPEEAQGKKLIVSIDAVRDMAEILVNDKSAEVRLWRPWEADVTDLVVEGSNELSIKVTNSVANFLEAHPRPSGLMGKARLIAES